MQINSIYLLVLLSLRIILTLRTTDQSNFDVLLAVHLGKTLANDQPDAQFFYFIIRLLTNSAALVRERTIPTERPPPVGEVSANFCG